MQVVRSIVKREGRGVRVKEGKGEFMCATAVPSFLEGILNGSAHHTDHHQYFRYNMGSFVRIGQYQHSTRA